MRCAREGRVKTGRGYVAKPAQKRVKSGKNGRVPDRCFSITNFSAGAPFLRPELAYGTGSLRGKKAKKIPIVTPARRHFLLAPPPRTFPIFIILLLTGRQMAPADLRQLSPDRCLRSSANFRLGPTFFANTAPQDFVETRRNPPTQKIQL